MFKIQRELMPQIEKWLFKGKILTIYGPRQVGKTTLAIDILKKYGSTDDYFDCDIPSVASRFQNPEPVLLKRLIGNAKLVVIDEAQRIENIGLTLKIIHDHMPDIQIIATGSSSFALKNSTNEPLTGRGIEFLLLPFSINEISQLYKNREIDSLIQFFMIYGLYPEVIKKNENDAIKLIENLAAKYLYKDILEFENLKKPDLLMNILQLLAFQIGAEVSKNEIAVKLGTSRETVERYIDLLEKAFVIFRLKPLARNQRNEVARKEKIYFYDNGIRNSIISAFQPIEIRNDAGALFENFMIAERLKFLEFSGIKRNLWFWRTHDQKEIDYIEEYNGKFDAFEFKWTKGKIKKSTSERFEQLYGNSTFKLITKDNYFEFL